MKKILETERLILRELDMNDKAFILELLNTEGWLKFIGDKNVRSGAQALEYIKSGPMSSYKRNGFGLYIAALKGDNIPIGPLWPY